MGFLQPAMLWGTLLVAVPIIIYLINRRRYQRRPWAAMEFLLRALKKHRRRLQIENLILLLIRIAALLLLAAALARPFVRSRALGVLSEKEENWIFAIDTSYSMGFKDGPRSLFERARELISGMMQDLVKPRDRVAIVTLDANPQLVAGPIAVTDSTRAELLRELDELELGYQSVDLTRSLLAIREAATRFEPADPSAPAIRSKKVVLFSDFQRKDWLNPDSSGPRDPVVLGLLKEIQDLGGEFNLANLEGSERNLSLLELRVSPEVVARDVWASLRATLRNWSKEDIEQVELKYLIDGQEEASLVLRVPAGETLQAPAVPYRFTEPGYHSITAELRSDGLVSDNRRFQVLKVRDEAELLVVDGEPLASSRDREVFFVQMALSPDPTEAAGPAEGRLTPYRPVIRTDDEITDLDPRKYILVMLANVADLPPRFLRDLEVYVRDGGALMVFLGKKVDPLYYNRELYRDGQGLLPARLEDVRGDARSAYHLVPSDSDHPLVSYFESRPDVTSLFQEMVEFKQFYRLSVPPAAGAAAEGAAPGPGRRTLRVPFRFNDAEGSPAAIDATFGQGRVLLFASTADKEWNDLPAWPDFVALLYQAIPYLIRFGETKLNLMVGETFRDVFDAADYAPEVMLIPPGAGEAAGGLAKQMTKIEGENRFTVTHEETGVPGIYELRLSRSSIEGAAPPAGGAANGPQPPAPRQLFAVNLDPSEGDLRALSTSILRDHFPGLQAHFFDAARELKELGQKKTMARGTELWRAGLWILLGLLLAETFLAQLFGRSQR